MLGARKIDYIKILDINKLIKPYKKTINIKFLLLTISVQQD